MVNEGLAIARPRGAVDDVGRELEAAIAVNVRALRHARGWSISELSERVGVSKAMLSKIENAQTSCSLSTLARLAKGLGVSAGSLLEIAPEPAGERVELITILGDVIRRLGGATPTS
ncbi:MAG: helix-turn-helix transcriptional regulator [Nocardioides sp.]|uniref:helix-turn-helix domain-containing protein n=1 Tax=Nocardioides sp. TaxID=35761 RepID=UPI0039E6BDF5